MPTFDSFDDLQDTAEDRAVAVEFGGLTLPWLLDGLAITRAAKHGVEVGEVLAQIQSLAPDVDPADVEGMDEAELAEVVEATGSLGMDALPVLIQAWGDLVWVGFLRFAPNLPRQDVQGNMDVSALKRLPTTEMFAQISASEDDELPAAKKEAGRSS